MYVLCVFIWIVRLELSHILAEWCSCWRVCLIDRSIEVRESPAENSKEVFRMASGLKGTVPEKNDQTKKKICF